MSFCSALDSVTWYNCLAEYVYTWKDLPLSGESQIIVVPDDYNGPKWAYNQLQVLWMIAVELFGDWGTSPRTGWIEDVKGFRQWVLDITETWRDVEHIEEDNKPSP